MEFFKIPGHNHYGISLNPSEAEDLLNLIKEARLPDKRQFYSLGEQIKKELNG